MGIRVGSATVQMRNAKKKSQKKNNAKSYKRTKKMLLSPQRGEIYITTKAQKVSERREALG